MQSNSLPLTLSATEKPDKDQRVYNADGELITLGHQTDKNVRIRIKGKTLELSLQDIQRLVEKEVRKALKKVEKRVVEEIEKQFPRGK